MDVGTAVPAAFEQVGTDDVPDLSLAAEKLLQAVGPGESGVFQIEQLDADLGQAAEGQIGHHRPVDRVDVAYGQLVRPRTAGNDDDLVEVLGELLGDGAVVNARRIEAAAEDGDFFGHKWEGRIFRPDQRSGGKK